jgi:hypothetical protein
LPSNSALHRTLNRAALAPSALLFSVRFNAGERGAVRRQNAMTRSFVFVIFSVLAGCSVDGVDIEIPAGYVGKATLQFENPTCPAMERNGGRKVVRVKPDGSYCTSSETLGSTIDLAFYYVSTDSRTRLKQTRWGEGGMIWGIAGPSSGFENAVASKPEYEFLVGTEASLRAAGKL